MTLRYEVGDRATPTRRDSAWWGRHGTVTRTSPSPFGTMVWLRFGTREVSFYQMDLRPSRSTLIGRGLLSE